MGNVYDIIVVGPYFFDEIYVGLPRFPEPGREVYCRDVIITPGATYITVAALTHLGVRTGWIGCIGTDYYSQYIHQQAQQAGLELSLIRQLDRPYRQVTTSLPYQGERAFVTVSDPQPDDMVAFLMENLASVEYKCLHFGWLVDPSYFPVIELAKESGAMVSADCQDIAIVDDPQTARTVIERLDLFMPNAREARTIAQAETIEGAGQCISNWVDLLVIKDGAHGSWIFDKSHQTRIPALTIDPVIDSTGAGDCFNAGFLYGYVTQGHDPEICGQYGNVCGGYSVTGVGGTAHLLTANELGRAISQHYSFH